MVQLKALQGPAHLSVGGAHNTLALVLQTQGGYEKATAMLQKAPTSPCKSLEVLAAKLLGWLVYTYSSCSMPSVLQQQGVDAAARAHPTTTTRAPPARLLRIRIHYNTTTTARTRIVSFLSFLFPHFIYILRKFCSNPSCQR